MKQKGQRGKFNHLLATSIYGVEADFKALIELGLKEIDYILKHSGTIISVRNFKRADQKVYMVDKFAEMLRLQFWTLNERIF